MAYIISLGLSLALIMLVASAQIESIQELKVSRTERDFERSLHMAEAGLNAYVNRLTFGSGPAVNPNDPSDPARLIPPFYAYPSGVPTLTQFAAGVRSGTYRIIRYPAGSQQGYFVGHTGGSGPSQIVVVSYGWSNGVVRRVQMPVDLSYTNSQDVPSALVPPGDYILYGVTRLELHANISVTGNSGSNGVVEMQNGNVFQGGTVDLCGPDASLIQGNNNVMTIRRPPEYLDWPTVDVIADELFPSPGSGQPSGLAYLAQSNDNNLATIDGAPGIPGSRIRVGNDAVIRLPGKQGGANYYITDFRAQNNCLLVLDNALGPVTIWIGPSGGNGSFRAMNNCVITATSTDARNSCRIYSGTSGEIHTQNNSGFGLGLYAYNVVNGVSMGTILIQNNAGFSGSAIANVVDVQNNEVVRYLPGPFFYPKGHGFYKIDGWLE